MGQRKFRIVSHPIKRMIIPTLLRTSVSGMTGMTNQCTDSIIMFEYQYLCRQGFLMNLKSIPVERNPSGIGSSDR